MALPVVKNALECANYTETVAPYLYQLRPLPQVVAESITNPLALKQIYLDTNPLVTAIAFSIAISPLFLIAAEFNRNYSQVDRFWSLLPTVYIAHYDLWARMAGLRSEKLDLLLAVSTIWSTRLTYNYWRKGGYSIGSEDYRWAIVKKNMGAPLFFLLDVVFISFGQSLLLMSITTPAYVLLLTSRIATLRNTSALEAGDFLAAALMLFAVSFTFVADQQQWNYHQAKDEYKKSGRVMSGYTKAELERGFLTSGLWGFSRHPNFAAEQSVWLILHGWACYSTELPFNWTGVGALGYLALFQGSTWLTEKLSAGKYPEYKQYQEQVGMFMPKFDAKPPKFGAELKKITDGAAEKVKKDAEHARERYNLRNSGP